MISRDPWRRANVDRAPAERMISALVLDALPGFADLDTIAAVSWDLLHLAGRWIARGLDAYDHGFAGDITRARRELRLLRDPDIIRREVTDLLSIYRGHLPAERLTTLAVDAEREIQAVAQAIVTAHAEVLSRRDRRTRRIVVSISGLSAIDGRQ